MRVRVRWLVPLLLTSYASQRAAASLIDDVVNGIVHAVDCSSCHAMLFGLKALATVGDSALISVVIAICKLSKAEDPAICEGTISSQGTILAEDLRNTMPFTRAATELCHAVIGLCQSPKTRPYMFPLPEAPKKQKQWTRKGRDPFQVAHFSDVHIDRQYAIGTEAKCTAPICCRKDTSVVGKPVQVAAGRMGSYGCDSPPALAHSMLRTASILSNSFSIFTGDVVEAAVWMETPKNVLSDVKLFNLELKTYLNTPVYPVIGNHETAPPDNFRMNDDPNAPSQQWVFDSLAEAWSVWLGPDATETVKHVSGSYSLVVPDTNLRLISMDTNYDYLFNFYLYHKTRVPDPNGILTFVSQQLQAAEDAGQRVWILGHIPPNSVDALYDQSNYFDQIVQRYKNTIAGQFYGHLHRDHFGISYSDYKNRTAENAVSNIWTAPSLTPRMGLDPGFKVYDVDPDTYEIMDARAYTLDLQDPQTNLNPEWKELYSARELYGSAIPGGWPADTPLTPGFWHKVTEAFERDDKLFQKYWRIKTGTYLPTACLPGDCKRREICGLRSGRAESNCYITPAGLNFRSMLGGLGSLSEFQKHPEQCTSTDFGTLLSRMSKNLAENDLEEIKAKLRDVVPPELAR